MKKPSPVILSEELIQKCNADKQFERFDSLFKTVIANPKPSPDKTVELPNKKTTRPRKKQ